jgi:TonB family protein
MPRASKRRRRVFPIAPLVVPAAREGALDRTSPLVLVLLALIASGMVHLVLVAAAGRFHRQAASAHWAPRESVRVAVVEKPAPPPPAVAATPGTPEAPVHRHTPRPAARPASATPRASEQPPSPVPTPTPAAPSEAPSAELPLLVPGLSLSATSQTGTLGVRTGSHRGGGGGPSEGGDGAAGEASIGEIAPAYALTEEPVFLDNVSSAEIRRYYPEPARRAKLEGPVRLKLLVDDQGVVRRATVVDDPTGAFRAAALKVARLYKFKPAKINGRHVATEIEFTIRFELD